MKKLLFGNGLGWAVPGSEALAGMCGSERLMAMILCWGDDSFS